MTEKKDKQTLAQKTEVEKQAKAQTVEQQLAGTEAGSIWEEIKNKDIDVFALPSQKLSQHCAPAMVEPSKLYLLTRFSAALPAIETACGKKFNVERLDKYVVVSRVQIPITQK